MIFKNRKKRVIDLAQSVFHFEFETGRSFVNSVEFADLAFLLKF